MISRGHTKNTPITWIEQWVNDAKQTIDACKILMYFPIFVINDGGIIETSQAGSMTAEGIPNDLFNNFNPLTIIVLTYSQLCCPVTTKIQDSVSSCLQNNLGICGCTFFSISRLYFKIRFIPLPHKFHRLALGEKLHFSRCIPMRYHIRGLVMALFYSHPPFDCNISIERPLQMCNCWICFWTLLVNFALIGCQFVVSPSYLGTCLHK